MSGTSSSQYQPRECWLFPLMVTVLTARGLCQTSRGGGVLRGLGFAATVRDDRRDRVAGLDRLPLLGGQRRDLARLVGGDLVLHLHRLDDADELALLDGVALGDQDLPHVALQRGDQLVGAAASAAGLASAALGRLAAAGRAVARRRGAGRGRERLAVHLDLEALARHLDGVGALLGLALVVGGLRGRLRERLEPLLVLD